MPLHSSQKIIEIDKNYTRFSYNVMVNYEFQQHLLMFITFIEIEKPTWLKLHIRNLLEDIVKKHK